jgi:hypothetical protein
LLLPLGVAALPMGATSDRCPAIAFSASDGQLSFELAEFVGGIIVGHVGSPVGR